MSNDLTNAKAKLDDLDFQKYDLEIKLMKLKCDIKEQKNAISQLKRDSKELDNLKESTQIKVCGNVKKAENKKVKKNSN